MNKTIVYGVVGGLLGALSAVSVKKVISVYQDVKAAVEFEVARARGTANPVDITPAFQESFREDEPDGTFQESFQESFREENDYGGYSILTSEEHKDVYIFDFESMHPSLESMHPEVDDLTFDEEGDDENVAMNNEEAVRRSVFHKMKIYGYQETQNMYLLHGNDKEGLSEMRYDANSEEALHQYKAMKIADVQRSEWGDVIYRFFDVHFEPECPMDDNIRITIESDREEFFGLESIHTVGMSTIAEVILYFAELMSLDFGESVDHFAEELVNNIGISSTAPEQEYTEAGYRIATHNLHTKNGYGMFGLTTVQMADLNEYTLFMEYNASSYFDDFDDNLD